MGYVVAFTHGKFLKDIPYGEKITVYNGEGNKKIEGELFMQEQMMECCMQ